MLPPRASQQILLSGHHPGDTVQSHGHTGRSPTVYAQVKVVAFTFWVIFILPTMYGEDEECAIMPEKIRIWGDTAMITAGRRKR